MRTPIFLALPFVLCFSEARAGALLKPTSGVSQALRPKTLDIKTHLRGVFAQTTVTTTYANPNTDRIEADFVYSAPPGSVVTGFAYWYGEEKVVARVVEKARAAQIYQYITSRMRDPALIEKIGKNAFRARIFPVEARTDLKIEIQLAQIAPSNSGGALWSWPMRDETAGGALERASVSVESDLPARSNFGALKWTRTNWRAKDDFRVQLTQPKIPLRASLLARKDGGPTGFFALSLSSDLPLYKPNFKISGVETYGVFAPKIGRLPANREFVVFGRYKNSGAALVSLGKESVRLDFPDVREKETVAGKLWANSQLEAWGKNPQKRAQIIALSTRFGIPSDFTSWLAIPEEERQNFKKQMLAADRDNAAKAYAQAVARGDQGAAKTQKTRFLGADAALQKLNRDYSSDEELQPLTNYLNEELKTVRRAVVQAKYGGASAAQRAQWQGWIANLQKAGASDGGRGVEMPVYVLEDELRIASRLLAIELEAGRGQGKRARELERRLKQLAKTVVAKNYGWDEDTFLDEQVTMRQKNLATEIAVLGLSGQVNRVRERELLARFNRLDRVFEGSSRELLREARENLWREKLDDAAQKVALEIEAGRENGPAIRGYRRELSQIEKRSGLDAQTAIRAAYENRARSLAGEKLRARLAGKTPPAQTAQVPLLAKKSGRSLWDIERGAAYQLSESLREKFVAEIQARRETAPFARQLETQRQNLRRQFGLEDDSDSWELKSAWRDRAGQTAQSYWASVLKNGADSPDAKAIHARGEAEAKKGDGNWEDFLRDEKRRAAQPLETELAPLYLDEKDETPRARELNQKLAALGPMPESWGYSQDTFNSTDKLALAKSAPAHETAYQLAEALQKTPNDKARIQNLRAQLEKRAAKAGKTGQEFLEVEAWRLEAGKPFLTAEKYFAQAGDPLISVAAPPSVRQILAIFPDGTLKPLEYNPQNRHFEARFDIPTHAASGDYAVQIVIVGANGLRQKLTLHFTVDTDKPSGQAILQNREIRLEATGDTDRVSAFLQNGTRLELKRGSDSVFSTVAPEGADLSRVQFVLTDRAHNRTMLEITP